MVRGQTRYLPVSIGPSVRSRVRISRSWKVVELRQDNDVTAGLGWPRKCGTCDSFFFSLS
jgi:hypothetical protein